MKALVQVGYGSPLDVLELRDVEMPRVGELVRSLGAEEVIDHRREDFARGGRRYDVFFDVGVTRPLADCRRVLDARGTLVVVGGTPGRWLRPPRASSRPPSSPRSCASGSCPSSPGPTPTASRR